jgi:putative CocE/NonD family hydrolase
MRLDEIWIPMPDGVRLAANRFLPGAGGPNDRFSVVLEYLPYRKDEGLFERDWDLYSYMTERGYACVKVDIRGTGRSEGVLPDREYSDVEHADGDAVIAWLAAQPWCTGAVAMWGISWGGFNSIQMASRRQTPEALKAIVAIDASDDLFHDDIHCIDGLFHVDEYDVLIDLDNARSGAPDFALDEETLRARFDQPPWKLTWLRHQRDGEFWRRASLRPNYERLRVPALLIGGWYDGYRDSVPRMLEHCRAAPVRGILAPHDHSFPHRGSPGPAFEHRAEVVRWFDRWLRDEPNGVEHEPKLAVYVRRWHPPGRNVTEIPGAWRLEDGWPIERARPETLRLCADHTLGRVAGDPAVHRLPYVASAGVEAGMWWGDLQPDQAPLDMVSLVYDSAPLADDVEILGFPHVSLTVATEAAPANWFARLCDVAPDGSVVLVTGAGTSGHDGPAGAVEFDLHVTSWTFERGHRMRLAVANALWPMIWPTPHPMTASLSVGEGSGSRLDLPVVPLADRPRPSFAEPEPYVEAPGWRSEGDVLPGELDLRRDGTIAVARWSGSSRADAPWGRSDYRESLEWRVDDLDPAHASVHGVSETTVNASAREIRWLGLLDIASDEAAFDYRYRRELWLDGERIREREWHERIPRDGG